jgi:hypothetical protein
MSLLRCPACSAPGSKVFDSRAVRTINALRRRRQCLSCRHRWTTFEIVADTVETLRARTLPPDQLAPGKKMQVGQRVYQITSREMRGDTISLTGVAL